MSAGQAFNAFEGIEPDSHPGEGRRAGADLAQIDRMAEQQGFTPRQAPEVAIKRQRGSERAVHQFTMRCEIRTSNAFVRWCEEERLSYREGFERLVAMIPELRARRQ